MAQKLRALVALFLSAKINIYYQIGPRPFTLKRINAGIHDVMCLSCQNSLDAEARTASYLENPKHTWGGGQRETHTILGYMARPCLRQTKQLVLDVVEYFTQRTQKHKT